MNLSRFFVIFVATSLFFGFYAGVFANENEKVGDENANACVYYFYGDECPFCNKLKNINFFENLQKETSPVDMKNFEVFHDRENALLLNKFFKKYGVLEKDMGVPVVFVGDTYFLGYDRIVNDLGGYILEKKPAECPVPGISQSPDKKSFSMLGIIGAAIVDSINPCAIAVILILLSALLAGGDRKKLVKIGISFIFAVFISYFVFGMGIFSAIKILGASRFIYNIVGIIAIIVGLLNIKDFFWYGKGFLSEIPRKWRPVLQKIIESAVTPVGAFIAGFIVTSFELPCTGGPYFFAIGLLSGSMSQLSVIPILLLYNLFFVLPLIAIFLIIYFGVSTVEKTAEWKNRNIKIFHLVAGIIMVLLGALVLLRVF